LDRHFDEPGGWNCVKSLKPDRPESRSVWGSGAVAVAVAVAVVVTGFLLLTPTAIANR